MPPTADQRAEARRILKEISQLGFVLPGTVTERRLTCTHQGCRCHGVPPRLHGPYWYWTRKVRAKTVSKSLTREQVEEYQAWFDNEKKLRALVHELEELGISIVANDPR
ncbi:MAG: DUF6788 family protein, partial [Acidimicrobiales bacterium]